MTNEQIGMVISLAGMLVGVISFQVKNKIPLLILQTVSSMLFMTSYIFSGGGIAIALNVIMPLRNVLFMIFANKRGTPVYIICGALCASYVAIYVVYTALAQEGVIASLWNALLIIAAFFSTISFANRNVNRLRMWKYGDSICWLTYNLRIGIGALGGILGEILNLVSLTVGIIRFRKKKQ